MRALGGLLADGDDLDALRELMRIAIAQRDVLRGDDRRFDAEESLLSTWPQVGHTGGEFCPGVPDDSGAGTAAADANTALPGWIMDGKLRILLDGAVNAVNRAGRDQGILCMWLRTGGIFGESAFLQPRNRDRFVITDCKVRMQGSREGHEVGDIERHQAHRELAAKLECQRGAGEHLIGRRQREQQTHPAVLFFFHAGQLPKRRAGDAMGRLGCIIGMFAKPGPAERNTAAQSLPLGKDRFGAHVNDRHMTGGRPLEDMPPVQRHFCAAKGRLNADDREICAVWVFCSDPILRGHSSR